MKKHMKLVTLFLAGAMALSLAAQPYKCERPNLDFPC